MSGRYETLELRVASAAAGLAVPGRIQRLLAQTLGIHAEEVGAIEPVERGRIHVEVALARSRRISTPMVLPLIERGSTSLWELRRSGDPNPSGEEVWLLSTDGKTPPTPGEIASALHAAYPTLVGAEELGLSFAGHGWVRVHVPERLVAYSEVPTTLTVGKKKLRIEVLR
jgi:hypothetical protein